MGDLHGKVALVTGAASKRGIGHAAALRLARDGADVVVVDQHLVPEPILEEDKRQGWGGLPRVVEEIEALGRQALAIKADITNSKEVKEMAKKALAKFGKIDILVNNAGIPGKYSTPVMDLDDESWNKVLATDLTGHFYVCKAFIKGMVERGEGGKIVNVASRAGKMATPGNSGYCAAKFGLIGFTQSLALELAPYKINVNAVCPGVTATDLRNNFAREQAQRLGITPDEARAQFYAKQVSIVPMGRVAKPDDMSNAIAFLASSDSDHITGESINVSAGQTMD